MPSASETTRPARPQLPRRVVNRPGLERRLDAVAPGGLGLVVASAGSGKSVLVRHWYTTRPELRVAALSLSRRHDDPAVLAEDLADLVRAVVPQGLARLDRLPATDGPGLGGALVEDLLHALSTATTDVVLVLDDVHVLTSQSLVQDLGGLVTALPPNARAVVITRRDLPWALHRLRLEDRVEEIRGADLAFREADARLLLETVSQRELPDEVVSTLVKRTDGWAVGLQLAALSLRTATDPTRFVETFAGSDHLVAEYLLDEVIERLEPDVRRFLLHTCVLDWLSADLCDAVTGTGNARVMLAELYRRSMFLIPLDPSGETFRYHHLFAEVLYYRLRLEEPEALDDLHHGAARWLLQNHREEEAVGHLLEAGDSQGAFAVISSVGHRLFERGQAATLTRWLSAIGAGDQVSAAAVEVNLLAAQLGSDDAAAATETYRRISRRADLTLGERTAANVLYSLLVFRDMPPEAVLRITDQVRDAVPLLAPEDVVDFLGIGGLDSVQVMGEYTAALAHFFSGDLARSATALEQVRAMPGMRYPVWQVYVRGSLALVRAWQGRSTEAEGLARSALEEARSFGISRHHASTHADHALALVHLDRLELDAAARSLGRARTSMHGRAATVSYFDLHEALEARLAAAGKGPVEALNGMQGRGAPGTEAPILRDGRLALRCRLLISLRDLPGAAALLDDARDVEQLVPARIDLALALGDVAAAREALAVWQVPPDDLRSRVRRLLREFVVLEAEGDERAVPALTEAVALAGADRLRWLFLEVPAALRAVRRGVVRAPWLTSDTLWNVALRLEPELRARATLTDALTDRELAVLAHLPSRMRNREIADELFVSVNTVKTQIGSIYRKLGVTERNEAVTRAEQLGLL